MSGFITAGSALVSTGTQAIKAAGVDLGPLGFLIGNQRSIDTIIPDVVITEHHIDRMQITSHPIANGTAISDHAFMLPRQLTMQCGWSNSNVVASLTQGFMAGGGFGDIGGGLAGAAGLSSSGGLTGGGLIGSFTEQRVKDIYKKLRDLQKAATETGKKFRVTTGKDTYENMMITELSVTTDRHSEYALFLTCTMQEVIMVNTQSATAPSQQNQADPKKTASTEEKGTVQPDPKDSSLTGGIIQRGAEKYLPPGMLSPTRPGGGG